MSNSSILGTIKKNCQSLISIFSSNDSDTNATPRRRRNAFNVKRNRRPQFHGLLAQKDTVSRLINLYRQNECLWNPNCPDYKCAEYQESVWKQIAYAIDENIPVVQIKRKVHVLRNQYHWEGARDMPQLFDYPDFGFLYEKAGGVEVKTVEEPRIDSGSAQTILRMESQELPIQLDCMITNKAQQIAHLCEVIRIDLEQMHDELFFEAKWKILDVLRDTQLKQLQTYAPHITMENNVLVKPIKYNKEKPRKLDEANSSAL